MQVYVAGGEKPRLRHASPATNQLSSTLGG